MEFIEALRKAVAHLVRKTRFHGFYLYRIISETGRGIDDRPGTGRLTLQVVTKADGLPDQLLIPKVHGAQGVSEDVLLGELVLVGFTAGDPAQPYVAHYLGAPAPFALYLDARRQLSIGATMETGQHVAIGSGVQQQIALAPGTIAAFQAVETFAAAAVTFANAVGVQVPALAGAAATLSTAASGMTSSLSTLLGDAPAGLRSLRTTSE